MNALAVHCNSANHDEFILHSCRCHEHFGFFFFPNLNQ